MTLRNNALIPIVMCSVFILTISQMIKAGSSDELGAKKESANPVVGGLRLTANIERLAVGPTDAIELVLMVENISEKNIVTGRTPLFSMYEIEVLQNDGKPAELTQFGKRIIATSDPGPARRLLIEPGAQVVDRIHLNRIYDMSLSGKYQITARRIITPELVVPSNSIVVTVSDAIKKDISSTTKPSTN